MLGTIQTAQDQLQKKRREEEILRLTIESVADGLITFDINGTIRQVNDSTLKMLGLDHDEEIVGRGIKEVIAKGDDLKFTELLDKTLHSGYGRTSEFTFVKRGGDSFPVEMSAAILKSATDQAIGIVTSVRDISERKKMEQALWNKEKQYRLLVESQSDLVVEINPQGELLFVNPAYEKIAGKTKEHLAGALFTSQVHPDDQEKVREIWEKLNRTQNTGYSEHRLMAEEGWRWLAWTFNAIFDEQQNMTSISCSGRDITESKIAKEELEKANVQLKELDKMKDNLLSTVSHELRTPLTSIKSFTEILLTYEEDKDTQKQFLGIISEETDRLTRLINDFLDLSKIQAGKMKWNNVELSIIDVVNSSVLSTRPLVQKANLELDLDIQSCLPHVMCDRDKLIQVFTNLLSNAIKFTREGGKITLKAWSEQGNAAEDRRVTMSITDTGIGIAPENHHKIFENFGQVGDALKDRPKGTGLGLPICKKIVENYGGKIWVESTLGQGTTFLFSLPAVKENTVADTIPVKPVVTPISTFPGASAAKGKTVLVVDDEANIRCFIQHELTKKGYQVIEAAGGREALEIARKYHPDLITLDISMPDINGLDVTAVVKNDPDIKDIPILVISVMEEKQRAFELGANDYINKPISIDLLMQRVNSLLRNSQKDILLVDDDEALAQSLAYDLCKRGFAVKTANSGGEALTHLEHNRADLILLDLKMPKMNGFEVMKVLKSNMKTAGIPVLILTGIDIDGAKSEALSNGAAEYFQKSGNFKGLFEAIERILKGKTSNLKTGDAVPNQQLVST